MKDTLGHGGEANNEDVIRKSDVLQGRLRENVFGTVSESGDEHEYSRLESASGATAR